MHLAFLATSTQLGGSERVLLDLASGIQRLRPRWSLTLCTPADGPLVAAGRRLDLRVLVVPFPHRFSATGDRARRLLNGAVLPDAMKYVVLLRRALRSLQPDIIHSNGIKTHIAAAWARPARARLVWHLHDYVSSRTRSAAFLRHSARGCSAIVANSQCVADDARRVLRGPIAPRAITNGVDLGRFTPDGPTVDLDALARLSPAPDGTVRVGLVATYARWKGHRTFLQALARIPSEIAVRGYVIGGPIYQTAGSQYTREELETEAARLGLRSRVGFIDFIDHVPPVLRSLDIVVHASTEPEPFGLAIAEAMACGRAVVIADTAAIGEFVTPGVDALAHRSGDAIGLAAAIATLARDRRLRYRLGHAARETAERHLGHGRFLTEFRDLYEELVCA